MMISRAVRLVLATTILAAALALPAMAGAATFSGGTSIVMDDPLVESNAITVTGRGGTYTVTDTAVPPVPGTGCAATANPNAVTCTVTRNSFVHEASGGNGGGTDSADLSSTDLQLEWFHAGAGALTVRCGEFDCFVEGADGNDTLVGGGGNDDLTGRNGNDSLQGGDGEDRLDGRDGNDSADGGAGEDSLIPDAGADVIRGGADRDRYNCSSLLAAVTITLDNVAGDGRAGENDDIGADIEVLTGTRYDDALTGSGIENDITGGLGNDLLAGGHGPDFLTGDAGNDTLRGGTGSDDLEGAVGDDVLKGERGDDHLTGGTGSDTLEGGAGEDWAEYDEATAPVVVKLDGKRNDGTRGERDNALVEHVGGSRFDDTLVGSNAANVLSGWTGNDGLVGLGGDDEIYGDLGDDVLDGGLGRDEVFGSGGDDRLKVRDGEADIASCGRGDDTVKADRRGDDVWVTCETVSKPRPPRARRMSA